MQNSSHVYGAALHTCMSRTNSSTSIMTSSRQRAAMKNFRDATDCAERARNKLRVVTCFTEYTKIANYQYQYNRKYQNTPEYGHPSKGTRWRTRKAAAAEEYLWFHPHAHHGVYRRGI